MELKLVNNGSYVKYEDRTVSVSVITDLTNKAKTALAAVNPSPDEYTCLAKAVIKPEEKILTEIFITASDFLGFSTDFSVKITDTSMQKEAYEKLKASDPENFEDTMDKAVYSLHGMDCERYGLIVDVFEDFLEERDVRIPTSDEEMGDDPENCARIYGSDYDCLVESLRPLFEEKEARP